MKTSVETKYPLTPQESVAVKTFLNLIRMELADELHSLVLFGSRSRGEGDEDSDIDILVLLKKEDDELKIKIWDYAYKIFSETEILISPLVMSCGQFEKLLDHERMIALTIQKEGIKL